MNVQSSKKAIELRRSGYSYADIARELKVSRTSVYNWVHNVRLTEDEKRSLQKNITSKIERGRMKASISIRSKNIFREKVEYETAEKEFEKLSRDPFFMLGLGLYTAHGLKKGSTRFQFSSSDVMITKIIIKWIEKYLNFPKKSIKYRLFIAHSHKSDQHEEFWSKSLGISRGLFSKTVYLPHNMKKDQLYKGSMTLIISRMGVIRKVIAWQKLTMRYYG